MSLLQVATVQSPNTTNDLTLQSANTSAGSLVIAANGAGVRVSTNAFSVGGQGINPHSMIPQKNRIINSQFIIDQRYDNAVTNCGNTAGFLGPDRWWVFNVKSSANYPTFQANYTSLGPYWSFFDWKNHATTGSTGAASDVFLIYQAIEGANMFDLQWGTANAQPITISWLCRTSQSANLTLSVRSSNVDRSYLVPFSTNSTWQYYSATIPGCTDGTWYSNASSWGSIGLDWGSGSTFTNSSINTWISGNYVSATGSTKLANVLSSNVAFTAVQCEKGTVNTSYEFITYAQELRNCYRYYRENFGGTYATYAPTAGAFHWITLYFPDAMRSTPNVAFTLSGGGNFNVYSAIGNTWQNTTLQVNATATGMVSYNYTFTANAEIA